MFFRLKLLLILFAIVVNEPNNINLAADVASASVTPVQINSDEQQNLINSERDQKDPELRKKFEDKLCENLSTKDKDGKVNKKISFEMDENDGIEKRAINRKQIAFLIDILQNKKTNTKNYYNYKINFIVD